MRLPDDPCASLPPGHQWPSVRGGTAGELGEAERCHFGVSLLLLLLVCWFYFLFPLVHIQVSKTFDPATLFMVENLKPNTEYVFRLAARSDLGLGAFTPEVRERTLQSSRCLSFPTLL